MVEFITKVYEPRKKTETQVENNSQQIAVLVGWSLSLANLPEFQQCFIFSYISDASKEGQKGQRAFKCKREG